MTSGNKTERPQLALGSRALTVDDVLATARGEVVLTFSPDAAERVAASATFLTDALARDASIYGVTTGVGDSVTNHVSKAVADELPLNLLRSHGCGTGAFFGEQEAIAIVVARLASLCRGYSGVRLLVLERLLELVHEGLLPRIPQRGSLGASGDLIPLSYVAALLVGERPALYRGAVVDAATAHAELGLTPLTLKPKESLALMNGTCVMTALACFAVERARRLARQAAALTAMASDVLRGNAAHFHPTLFELKPHPGQLEAAQWIRDDIDYDSGRGQQRERLQDRYSIRCAPHVIGVLLDALTWIQPQVEIELNSVNDNPLLDTNEQQVLHGGNFYGGHIAFAMDGLKAAVASIADLLDRQLMLLLAGGEGLPANLTSVEGPAGVTHHGFKAMSIAASALAAEAQKLTMPAAAFSRSAEMHNQDKVPLGTIAARDCLQVLELAETVAAIHTLALCQGVDLRQRHGCHARALAVHEAVRGHVAALGADRAMDVDIASIRELMQTGRAFGEVCR